MRGAISPSPEPVGTQYIDLAQSGRVWRLHSASRAASIRTMILSSSLRRVVAGVAGMMLLLCQTAIAAHGCILGAPSPSDSVMLQPCHEAESEAGGASEHDLCQAHCLSQQAMPAVDKIPAFAAVDLPALTVRLDQPLPTAYAVLVAASLPARAASPPLIIIHCRLRN